MLEVNQKHLVRALTTLGAAKLSDFLGKDQTERLNALGIEITAATMAEFFVAERGVDIFTNSELRLEMFLTFPTVALSRFLESDGQRLGDLIVQFNRFNWGDNDKSRRFLSLLGVSAQLLEKPSIDKTSSVSILVQNPLHLYQNWLRKKVLHELQSCESQRFLLHMPTGAGKTRTALEAVVDYIRSQLDSDITIVWFAHSDELCVQACESMQIGWGLHGSEEMQMLKLWGSRPIPELNSKHPKFVVTSFQTAYQMLQTASDERFALFAEIKRKCRILIVDEAHQSTAPTYKEAIELFSNPRTKVVGLTATPGRHHVNQDGGETDQLSRFYSGRKISIVDDKGQPLSNPIEFLTKKGILSKVDRYQLNTGQDFELSPAEIRYIEQQLEIPANVLKKIGKNAARTNLVASHAANLAVNDSASVIIFAPSKDNAVELASLLLYKGIEAGSVTGDTPAAVRREIIDLFKEGKVSVLVNYGVLTTGFDAPNIDAVIVARPTTSVVLYSQMIGRGLRGPAMGGTYDCKIIDVVDNIVNMPTSEMAFTYFDEYYE